MPQKYRALRIISLFYRLFAAIMVIAGVIALIASIVMHGSSVITGILALLGSCVGALTMFGIGELFQLFIDIEENTRANVAVSRQLLKILGRENN